MSQLFELNAQKAGFERQIEAEADGFGITLIRDGNPSRVSSADEAIRDAGDYMAEFLRPAARGGIPWGLRIVVLDGVAVYGEWPLVGGGGRSPSFQKTPLVQIRERWHDSGPLSALENAIQIIRAYTPRGRGARREDMQRLAA
jgi:hypothetical protein